jgi:hypothetical protein
MSVDEVPSATAHGRREESEWVRTEESPSCGHAEIAEVWGAPNAHEADSANCSDASTDKPEITATDPTNQRESPAGGKAARPEPGGGRGDREGDSPSGSRRRVWVDGMRSRRATGGSETCAVGVRVPVSCKTTPTCAPQWRRLEGVETLRREN